MRALHARSKAINPASKTQQAIAFLSSHGPDGDFRAAVQYDMYHAAPLPVRQQMRRFRPFAMISPFRHQSAQGYQLPAGRIARIEDGSQRFSLADRPGDQDIGIVDVLDGRARPCRQRVFDQAAEPVFPPLRAINSTA